jgi:glyoxylase-like metal-dependent hydrolase (beta-lactamase superfamily II)
LLEKLPEGVLHAALPTPFPVGPVNCWVFAERPVTVVDPGMLIPDSMRMVEDLLASVGLRPADVDQVVVTHGHPDHFGAAAWLADTARAPILCGHAERSKLIHLYGQHDRAQLRALLHDFGIPEEIRDAIPAMFEAVTDLVQKPRDDQVVGVDDDERLDIGGFQASAIITPGHAAGHLSLWLPDARALVSGDHLLPRITPNPLIEPDADDPLGRRRSLVEYLDSLERFVALDPPAVLPGHGEAFTDVAALAVSMRAHHVTRATEIGTLVAELGRPTAYQLTRALFPHLEGFAVMLGISEIVGHIDLLLADGRVTEVDGSPRRYVVGNGG